MLTLSLCSLNYAHSLSTMLTLYSLFSILSPNTSLDQTSLLFQYFFRSLSFFLLCPDLAWTNCYAVTPSIRPLSLCSFMNSYKRSAQAPILATWLTCMKSTETISTCISVERFMKRTMPRDGTFDNRSPSRFNVAGLRKSTIPCCPRKSSSRCKRSTSVIVFCLQRTS